MAITKLSLDLFFIRNVVRLTFEACHLQLGLSFHCLFCGAFLLTTTTHYHQKMDRNSNNGLSLNVRSSAEIGFFLIPPNDFRKKNCGKNIIILLEWFIWNLYLFCNFVFSCCWPRKAEHWTDPNNSKLDIMPGQSDCPVLVTDPPK